MLFDNIIAPSLNILQAYSAQLCLHTESQDFSALVTATPHGLFPVNELIC